MGWKESQPISLPPAMAGSPSPVPGCSDLGNQRQVTPSCLGLLCPPRAWDQFYSHLLKKNPKTTPNIPTNQTRLNQEHSFPFPVDAAQGFIQTHFKNFAKARQSIYNIKIAQTPQKKTATGLRRQTQEPENQEGANLHFNCIYALRSQPALEPELPLSSPQHPPRAQQLLGQLQRQRWGEFPLS